MATPSRPWAAALAGTAAFALLFAGIQVVELVRQARAGDGPIELVVDVLMVAAWLASARICRDAARRLWPGGAR